MVHFVVGKGENLHNLGNQYAICLPIINEKCFNLQHFRKIVEEQNEGNFYIFITRKEQLTKSKNE